MMLADRRDAGQKLALKLNTLKNTQSILFALPRGGVPVSYEISKSLEIPMRVAVVRKLGFPYNEELGFGALAPKDTLVINHRLLEEIDLSPEQIEEEIKNESRELRKRLQLYNESPEYNIFGKTAIIVDDGIATGVTVLAAIEYVKSLNPKEIIIAVPIISHEALLKINNIVKEVVYLQAPKDFRSVGCWYKNFEQTSDQEVIELINERRDISYTHRTIT